MENSMMIILTKIEPFPYSVFIKLSLPLQVIKVFSLLPWTVAISVYSGLPKLKDNF